MTETTSKPDRKTPRWVKILLVLSLAFNLLIIGAVSAKVFMPHHRFGGKGPHMTHGPLARPGAMYKTGRYLMRQLSRERRYEMMQLVRMHRANMQNELKNLATARLDFARLIASQPDNKAGFDKTYAAVKQAEAALHEKASALTRDFISNLTPQERVTYAEILQNPPRRRWFRRR